MTTRNWVGDAGLAVLLALPTATLANPATIWQTQPSTSAPHAQIQPAPTRFSLPR